MTADDQTPVDDEKDSAPDATTQGVDDNVETDESTDTVTTRQESRLGPGAGENSLVKVTGPVQREGDEVTRHPTMRENKEDSQRRTDDPLE